MNRISALPLAMLVFCCAVGGASAQQRESKDRQAGSPPVAGAATIGVTVAQADLVATGHRASKLLHADVYNDQDQKIGKIDDLVIAPDGTLSVAVVNVGGFLGVARHRVAIPVEQFSEITPKRIVLPGATKEALKDAPEFKYAPAKA
jgi:hypothetical protein